MDKSLETKLMELCRRYIDENDFNCAETIFQSDRAYETAPDFLVDVCNLIGYSKSEQGDGFAEDDDGSNG